MAKDHLGYPVLSRDIRVVDGGVRDARIDIVLNSVEDASGGPVDEVGDGFHSGGMVEDLVSNEQSDIERHTKYSILDGLAHMIVRDGRPLCNIRN